ncbi:MAG: carbohydrate kinase [Akkermansiaceae bacterium]|nr:carbohydrate kinase [Akkermansiaceae bacterium]
MKTMNDSNSSKQTDAPGGFRVAGIGEVLWDVFPNGQRLGGAPTNFACHCRQLGATAFPVSCVGDDALGRRTVEELERLGVDVRHLQTSAAYPTGRVLVELDETGKPDYQILEGVAWEQLEFTDGLDALARSLDAVCFGTLAQRSEVSRRTIRGFLKRMPERALKILDVNLRQPFFSRALVEESLALANVVKLSDEELPVLAGYFELTGGVNEQLAGLRERFSLKLVAYTRGADGSVLVTAGGVQETGGVAVTPVDSVGAGDSFTAALCIGLLTGMPLPEVNQFANRVAAFVCSKAGATPILPESLKTIQPNTP